MADYWPVADPDLQIRGGHSSRPLDKWGGGGLKKFFSALQASIWFKSKGGGVGPLPGSATAGCLIGGSLMLVQLYLSTEWIHLPKNSIKYKSWHFELQELDFERIIY